MDENDVLSNSKVPSTDSSEDTGSSDEETGGGSSSGSGSDQSTSDNAKPSRRPSAVKAAVSAALGCSGKRAREFNGEEDEENVPPKKKKRPAVTTRVHRAAPKPTAEQSKKKSASKTKRSKLVKEKASAVEKKSATKRNNAVPTPRTSVLNRSEDEAPQKTKNLSRSWSPDEELALSRELWKGRISETFGSSPPSSRTDPYWHQLLGRLSFMDKYEEDHRLERLIEKVRRMKVRYESLNLRLRGGETSAYKNSHEQALWKMWDRIWSLDKVDHETVSEEEEDASDEGSPEEGKEEIVPSQATRHQAVVRTSPVKKKLISQRVVVLDETDDDDEEDDALVKATPPPEQAAHAVPAILASAAASGAGKQGRTSKSDPTNVPAVPAMNVECGRNTSSVVVHNGTQGGHALISVRADCTPAASDEIRGENLAFLHDMRRICVQMVEDTKAHSEKILEETCVKTTQLLDRLSFHASQSRCGSDISNPFQGVGLLKEPHMCDPNHSKWCHQRAAEEGLVLQRLQLAQEEARIQLDGMRLKLSMRKQQFPENAR